MFRHLERALLGWGWSAGVLVSSLWLSACTLTPGRVAPGPSVSRHLSLDTESAARLRQAAALRNTPHALTLTAPRAALSRLSQLAPLLLSVLESDEATNELEKRLEECARKAETQVNFSRFGNRAPTRLECGEEVEVDGCGEPITQAMALGRMKHTLALACAREVLSQLWPTTFSIEQRYRFFRSAQIIELVSLEEERRLITQGCFRELWRTIKPDIVLHADNNPLRAVLILDFKFPCPDTNTPQWTRYHRESAYAGSSQGRIYKEALGGEALLISPQGVTP